MEGRIERDPHLEVCPDFSTAHYNALRTLIVNTGATAEEATGQMRQAWELQNAEKRELWILQAEADKQARDEVERLAKEQENQEKELARRERDKKRPRLADFDSNRMVGSYIAPRPSTYALNKLENFEYVELYYFTKEGCIDALNNHHSEASDAYGLTRVGDTVGLRQVAAVKSSKNVIQDADLSWNQMTYAKASYIQHAAKAGWPEKHVDALVHFFIGIETSAFRVRSHGEKVLLQYQARVRRHWQDCLKREEGATFNIALIDNRLLESISNEVWDAAHAENKREVSNLHKINILPC